MCRKPLFCRPSVFGLQPSVLLWLAMASVLLVAAEPAGACFSIVVGKDASSTGCVLVAHNEDDTPPQVVNHHKVPRQTHSPGQFIRLRGGGQVEQVAETWAYVWSEMPGMSYSDSFVNEWGVCVTSDNCPSREDRAELTDGGIGAMLRRLVAQRARNAREGVRIAGELVERFGYVDSGRTYVIADSEEGWLFCVVQGKHWLARRVDEGEVAMVANTYTVREVDLSDSANVLASKDILSYAVGRGWCDSKEGEAFDFAATYASPAAVANPGNYGRQTAGLHYVAANPPAIGDPPPFSVTPDRKLGVADLIRVLRHNRSGNTIDTVGGRQVVCNGAEAICRGSTQTSFVARLGTTPSRDLGLVYWVCLAAPETSVFVPFPFGMADFPEAYRSDGERPSEAVFAQRTGSPFWPDRARAFWTFANFRQKAQAMPSSKQAEFLSEAEEIERKGGEGMEEARGMAAEKGRRRALAVSGEAYDAALRMMGEAVE